MSAQTFGRRGHVGRHLGRPQMRAGLMQGGVELGELQFGDGAQGVLERMTSKAESGTRNVHDSLRTGETGDWRSGFLAKRPYTVDG